MEAARGAIAAVSADSESLDGGGPLGNGNADAEALARDLLGRFREEISAEGGGGSGARGRKGGGGTAEVKRAAAAARAAKWLLSRFSWHNTAGNAPPDSIDTTPTSTTDDTTITLPPADTLLPASVSADSRAVRATTSALQSAAFTTAAQLSEEVSQETLKYEEELSEVGFRPRFTSFFTPFVPQIRPPNTHVYF